MLSQSGIVSKRFNIIEILSPLI